jgi:hypothetical protein
MGGGLLVHLERQGDLSVAKRKVFEKQNAGSIVFSRYHGENSFRNVFNECFR